MKTKATAATEAPDEEKSWRAEADLRCLIDAEKVKADPERLKGAMKKYAEMEKAMKGIKS